MKGLIVAYGEKDSQGRDRLSEPRGLIKFGGKEVVKHTLDKFREIGIQNTSVIIHPFHKEAYENALKNKEQNVQIIEYKGSHDPAFVYMHMFKILGNDSHIISAADDNLFDFSLEGLVKKAEEVDGSVMGVRDIGYIDTTNQDFNFAKCLFDEKGKITATNYSFSPDKKEIDSKYVALDIYFIHKKTISTLLQGIKNLSTPHKIIETATKDFYAWIINDGFWADIGKPPLRKKAEEYFSV